MRAALPVAASRAARPPWLFPGLLVAWTVALLLRLWNLRAQVLGGDELHAVRLSMSTPIEKILFRHTEFDHGRPLTAALRWLMDAGVVFDELTFRAPVLVCGLALCVLLPLLVRRPFGSGAALTAAWLCALSPVLVLYSRILRTYVPVALLGLLAAGCFYTWLTGARPRHAIAYVACAVLAVFTHLLSAPFVLAPLLFVPLERLLSRRGARLGSWALLAAATAAVLVALHWPLREGLMQLATTRAKRGGFDTGTLWKTLGMQAGSGSVAWTLAFWSLAGIGAWRAFRIRPRLAGYCLFLGVVQVATLLALGPKQSEQALVFNRYVLLLTPFLLASVALALGRAWYPESAESRTGRERLVGRLQPIVATAFLIAAFLVGPLATRAYRESSFVHHNRFVAFADEKPLPDVAPPLPYAALAPGGEAAEESGAVLEFPWNSHWNHSLAPLAYQGLHGREVVVAGRQVTAEHPRVALRNAVAIDVDPIAAFLASRARWLVVHLDMGREELRFHERSDVRDEWDVMRGDGVKMARELARRFGAPRFADPEVAIWDLEAARLRDARAAGKGRGQGD